MEAVRFKDYLMDYLEYHHITNKEFANRIGITPKHLIDILSGKRDLSSNLINHISIVTDIPSDYIYRIEANYKFEQAIETYLEKEHLTRTQYLKRFHYQYLIKEKFLNFVDPENKMELIKDILKFLRVPTPEKVYEIDQTAYYKSKNEKPELLLLWLEKCYQKTLEQKVKTYRKENIEFLVCSLREYARQEQFDEEQLVRLFNENGIYLVIQDDIPGSKIRGAFKVHRGIPAIYLTHKHQRIADIYFALFHELAHCKTDFNKAQAASMVSYEQELDQAEEKADQEAYQWMVPDAYYQKIRQNPTYQLRKETSYPKSFIAYRFAKDGVIDYGDPEYQRYNFLLSEKNRSSKKNK